MFRCFFFHLLLHQTALTWVKWKKKVAKKPFCVVAHLVELLAVKMSDATKTPNLFDQGRVPSTCISMCPHVHVLIRHMTRCHPVGSIYLSDGCGVEKLPLGDEEPHAFTIVSENLSRKHQHHSPGSRLHMASAHCLFLSPLIAMVG